MPESNANTTSVAADDAFKTKYADALPPD